MASITDSMDMSLSKTLGIVNILGSLGPLVSHMISSAAVVGEQPQTVVNDWLWLFMKTTFTKTA